MTPRALHEVTTLVRGAAAALDRLEAVERGEP